MRPPLLDDRFGEVLRSRKSDFVTPSPDQVRVEQHGAAHIPTTGWPGWPMGLSATEPVIETFVAGPVHVMATSDNDRFVAAWTPVAEWMNTTVRTALAQVGTRLVDDAYVTASLTPTAELEGLAHLDDDQFIPDDSVAVVAILGELAGPRIATTAIEHTTLRPMGSLTFDQATLDGFAMNALSHCAAAADQLVVFPQFGQLHAGPAADHVVELAPYRQLLVLRAAVVLP